VISHFKNWTIMHIDYRRPLRTFETTISAVVGLHFYRTSRITLIECKSTTAPWVAFYGGNTAEIEPSLFPYIMEGKWIDCQLCNDLDAVYSLGPGPTAPMAYAVTEKRTGNNGKDHAREAVLSATSAAIAVLDEGKTYGKAAPVHYSLTVFPLVVTKSPIVSCSLDTSGDVVLSQIDSCWISSVHEKRDTPIRVLIVTFSAFKNFAAKLASIYNRLGIE
jgi:hypothetical protein